jgi:predicted metal-binding membrane protein
MPTMSPVITTLTSVAMMVAMMLPSVAPTVWRYQRHVRAAGRTTLFVMGYASVWIAFGLALLAMSGGLSPTGMASAASPPHAPWAIGALMLGVGTVQRSRWKAKILLRCHPACVAARAVPSSRMIAWRDGLRLGVACALSCAAPMAVLLVTGLMDTRMMAVVTAAITLERVTPAGERVARATGALALVGGLVMWVA